MTYCLACFPTLLETCNGKKGLGKKYIWFHYRLPNAYKYLIHVSAHVSQTLFHLEQQIH